MCNSQGYIVSQDADNSQDCFDDQHKDGNNANLQHYKILQQNNMQHNLQHNEQTYINSDTEQGDFQQRRFFTDHEGLIGEPTSKFPVTEEDLAHVQFRKSNKTLDPEFLNNNNNNNNNVLETENKNDDNKYDSERTKSSRRMTMPGFNLGSRISVESFPSTIFTSSSNENRLLDPAAVQKMNSVLLSSGARVIAGHVTKVDLEVLRIAQCDDLGVGVTSGVELCTLPQGQTLRDDVIER